MGSNALKQDNYTVSAAWYFRKEEDPYWYHFRPQETINEVNELIRKVQHALEDGFALPRDTYLKVFRSSLLRWVC